ncbi:MAG: putative quinol monooxygenase [Ilumatobacteraceae bacterium]
MSTTADVPTASTGTTTIVVAGTFPVDGSQAAALSAAANAMRVATLQEDGCIEYRFSFATDDANTMMVFEEWRDQDALTAHFGAPHMAIFQAAMAGFVSGAPVVDKFAVTGKGPLR